MTGARPLLTTTTSGGVCDCAGTAATPGSAANGSVQRAAPIRSASFRTLDNNLIPIPPRMKARDPAVKIRMRWSPVTPCHSSRKCLLHPARQRRMQSMSGGYCFDAGIHVCRTNRCAPCEARIRTDAGGAVDRIGADAIGDPRGKKSAVSSAPGEPAPQSHSLAGVHVDNSLRDAMRFVAYSPVRGGGAPGGVPSQARRDKLRRSTTLSRGACNGRGFADHRWRATVVWSTRHDQPLQARGSGQTRPQLIAGSHCNDTALCAAGDTCRRRCATMRICK